MNFKILVSMKNNASMVHAAVCRCVVNKSRQQGAFPRTADNAHMLAAEWDRDNDTIQRKIPPTGVCLCCAT